MGNHCTTTVTIANIIILGVFLRKGFHRTRRILKQRESTTCSGARGYYGMKWCASTQVLSLLELPETAEDSVKWMEWRSDNTAMEKKLTWAGNDDDEGCGSVRLFAWLPRKTQRYNWRNYVAINKTRDITRELAFIIQWIIFYRFLEVIKTYRVFSLLIAHSKCTVYKTLQDFLFCWKIFIWNSPSLYFS